MNVLIVDDDELAVHKLRKRIADVDTTLTIRGITGSIEESVNWLGKTRVRRHRPKRIAGDLRKSPAMLTVA